MEFFSSAVGSIQVFMIPPMTDNVSRPYVISGKAMQSNYRFADVILTLVRMMRSTLKKNLQNHRPQRPLKKVIKNLLAFVIFPHKIPACIREGEVLFYKLQLKRS